MSSQPIVIDIETQHSFQEVNYDYSKLKISVVGLYDYLTDSYQVFREHQLNDLFKIIEHSSQIIGFNIRKFDLPVLAPYYLGNFKQFEIVDILELVESSLGFRIALDSLARATLGVKKSGHGFLAINYFREGDWENLEKYCLMDVKITKDLFDFLQKNGKLVYQSPRGLKDIKINLPKKDSKKNPVSLSLPF